MNQEILSSEPSGNAAVANAATPAHALRVPRFVEYALAFEQVYVSNEWHRLEEFFTPDAVRQVVGGGPLSALSIGRKAVVADLRSGVEALDRRFDLRLPEIISGPTERDGVVWIDWRLTFQRRGIPDLVIEGTHGTAYDGDRICRLDEALTNATTEKVEAYLAQYGAQLLPTSEPPLPKRDATLSQARMRSLVDGYARAKSRADAAAALALCTPDFRIETVPFGIASRDRDETALHLAAFFATFPDYSATVTDMAFGDASVGCWGTVRMTMKGGGFGLEATNRTAEVPFFSAFTFADGLLASERFLFDMAAFCDGIGVPIALMREGLDNLRAAQDGIIAGG